MKTCKGKNGPHQYDASLPCCPECKTIYWKQRQQNPEFIAFDKNRKQQSDYKSSQAEWQRAWRQTPEGKNYLKEYDKSRAKSPERKLSQTIRQGKRTSIGARGDLTTQQWLERIAEFDGKCAYCSVLLLTNGDGDGVDQYHLHYLTIDHIVPLLKKGIPLGEHTKSNVVPSCRGCNNSKLNNDVWEWMKRKGIVPNNKLLIILLAATKKS